jgi:hypothetical protein
MQRTMVCFHKDRRGAKVICTKRKKRGKLSSKRGSKRFRNLEERRQQEGRIQVREELRRLGQLQAIQSDSSASLI